MPTPLSFVSDRPDVWRGSELSHAGAATLPTGHALLDAQLPGGGWPGAGLVELLQARPAQHDWRLLLPALAGLTRAHSGPVVLVGSPEGLMPFVPALAAQGVLADRWLWVQASADASRLWATEQALRCVDVIAVLAWLPRARSDALRRLHMVAMEHGKPLFAFRPASVQQQSSAAPLRLLLDGTQSLEVHLLKRRGPPLASPLLLPPHEPRLAALLQARRKAMKPPKPLTPLQQTEPAHALDRAVTA